MSIRLRIERLVLEGLPMSPHQGPLVQAAMEQELSRLLNARGMDWQSAAGGAMAELQGGTIQAANLSSPMQLGAQIAGGLYAGIGDRK